MLQRTLGDPEMTKFIGGPKSDEKLVERQASNALCAKLGFTLLAATDFEYPPGNILRCNDWRLDLTEADATP